MQFLIDFFGANDFMPHGTALLWNPTLLSLFVLSDIVIALSCCSVSITLFYFIRRRNDFPFPGLLWLFVLFLVACGTTHLFAIIAIWLPLYWLDGLVKAFTGVISVAFALMMYRVIPLALKLRSPSQLESELAYQNDEKASRAAELVIANVELAHQTDEKASRAAELVIANVELVHQSDEKANRAAELVVANVELAYQSDEKAKREAELQEVKEEAETVRELAFYDALTSLPNRRLLNDRLTQAMLASRRSGCYSALLFLDLDNFKSLNDTHGHKAGDLLLKEVAQRLLRCIREVDTVARFGGDEFVVVLSELGKKKSECVTHANTVAEKIRTVMAESYWLNYNLKGTSKMILHHCTASIGVVLFNGQASEDDILKWADKAMYTAKEGGRNQFRFYDGSVE